MKVLVTMASGGLWGLLMLGLYDDPPLAHSVGGAILIGFIVQYFVDQKTN